MLQKHEHANTEALNRGRARGFVIERHVAAWFERRFESLYRHPDNHGRWTDPCDHDFKLDIGDKTYRVDVAGPDRYGKFRMHPRKPKADLHLLCRIDGKDVAWIGVETGQAFAELGEVDHLLVTSPHRMMVWLNCISAGIDYRSLLNAVEAA
jgi:hypothetical protein